MRHRAAAVLHFGGAETQRVAGVLTPLERVEEQWAVHALRYAAEQDLLSGRISSAVQRLELVTASSADPVERADITTALMRAEWRYSPVAAARHLDHLLRARRESVLSSEADSQLIGFLVPARPRDDSPDETRQKTAVGHEQGNRRLP